MSMVDYPLRSLMFVPAHNLKLMNNAIKTDADVLLLDLEDSVQPKSNKEVARKNIVDFIKDNKLINHKVFPRINDRESGELLRDVNELTIDGVEGFMYPKSYTSDDICFIDKLLEAIEYQKGYDIGRFKLIPLIETTSAVLNADSICKASNRIIAIAFGCEDYLMDLEGINDDNASTLFTARSLISMAARSQKVIPIDTVHIKVHDLEDLEKNIITARNLGFEGMLVLNPKELALGHRYYSPSEEEVNNAKQILDTYEETKKIGAAVAIVNGKFIGPPFVKKAKKIIEKQKKIQENDEYKSRIRSLE